jgi:hypothetical protein
MSTALALVDEHERELPQNLEAERSVLGAVLLEAGVLARVVPILGADDFFADAHRRIFFAMLRMASQSTAIDLVTVKDELVRAGALEKAGGAAYLTSLVDNVPDVANVEHYARIVKEKSSARRLVSVGQQLVRGALSQEEGAGESARRTIEEILRESPGAPTLPSISTSLLDLDENPPPPVRWAVDGLLPERALCLLFGKPFGGKSLFALQLCLYGAAQVPFLPPPDGSSAGFTMPRPLRILYLDEEMGLPLLCKRERMMRAGRPEFSEPDVRRRFRVISRAGLRLDDESKLEHLRRELGSFPGGAPDLLIQDTLRRMHGAAEKDSETMAALTAAETAIAEEFGTTVLPIHHSKKGPQDDEEDWREAARGSGDLVASCQAVIAIWKTADLLFSARADAKAAGEIEPFPLILDPQTLLYRRQSEEERFATKEAANDSAVKEATATLCKALRRLKEGGATKYPSSWRTWREKAGGRVGTLTQARLLLESEGTVCKVKRSGRGGGEVYMFPEDHDGALGFGSRSGSQESAE